MCHNIVRALFLQVLHVLVRKYEELHIPDYINICQVKPSFFMECHNLHCNGYITVHNIISVFLIQCYIFLDDPDSTAQLLEKLAKGSKVNLLPIFCTLLCDDPIPVLRMTGW